MISSPFWMSGSGRETLPNVSEWSGVPPGCPVVVSWPSWMSGSGQQSLPDVRQWMGGLHECPVVVGSPYRMSLSGGSPLARCLAFVGRPSRISGRPSQLSGSDRLALSDVQESIPVVWEWWEALPDICNWSGDPSRFLVVVKRPSRMSGSGRVAFPDFQEWSGDPPGCPGVFVRPSRLSGSGREALPDVQE